MGAISFRHQIALQLFILVLNFQEASVMNLVVAAIVLWNTVYLGRAIHGLREQGESVDENLLAHLSPLGWEHINLTGDYVWHSSKRVAKGRFRPLRSPKDS
jgi:hypothetical protein